MSYKEMRRWAVILGMFILGLSIIGTQGASAAITFSNPIGTSDVSTLLNNLLSTLQKVVAYVAIAMLLIGGIMYMLSAGDDKAMGRAKNIITTAIIGLAIVMAAPAFLNEVISIMGGSNTVSTGSGLSLTTIVTNVLNFLLSIIGIIAIMGLVIGGTTYMTAYGDDKKIERAKKMISASIIGIVVAFGALVLVQQLSTLIEGTG